MNSVIDRLKTRFVRNLKEREEEALQILMMALELDRDVILQIIT
jgi:hypothetical protein